MRIAKETTSSFKSGGTNRGIRGIAVAAKNPAQLRGRSAPKGASAHAGSTRSASAGRKGAGGKGSAK